MQGRKIEYGVRLACCAMRACVQSVKTNRENEGLISADRKTSLLSHLQYPVSLESSTIDLLPSACLVAIACGTGPKPIVTRVTPGSQVVAFQHGFWLRGVQP